MKTYTSLVGFTVTPDLCRYRSSSFDAFERIEVTGEAVQLHDHDCHQEEVSTLVFQYEAVLQ